MSSINDISYKFVSDSRSSDSSPLVCAYIFSSSYYHFQVSSHSIPIIIIVFDNFELEILSSGFLDKETYFNEFFFDVILF